MKRCIASLKIFPRGLLKGNTIPSESGDIKAEWVGLVWTSLTRSAFVLDNHKGPHIPADTLALSKFLNLEEQVADLVDYFGVSTCLTTRKALIGSEDKI
jgi:hypothetical protein